MNTTKSNGLKGDRFTGPYQPRIKRVRQQPRTKIRQLLRSFIPLELPGQATRPRQQSGQQ